MRGWERAASWRSADVGEAGRDGRGKPLPYRVYRGGASLERFLEEEGVVEEAG
jgi:hypothetical protein